MNNEIKMEHAWISVYDFLSETEFNAIDEPEEEIEGNMYEQII